MTIHRMHVHLNHSNARGMKGGDEAHYGSSNEDVFSQQSQV
jgi:hypothetical protein